MGQASGLGIRTNKAIERDTMRNHTKRRTTGCRAGRMAWVFLASAALLVGCAAQPKNTAPPEQAAQPAPPEAQAAVVVRPTEAPENETTPPPSKPTERPAASAARSSKTVQVKTASAGSAKNQPVASVAGQTDDRSAAKPTIGARASRSQARASAAAVPERRHPAQGPPAVSQDRATAKPQPDRKAPKPAAQKLGEKAKEGKGCGGKAVADPTASATGPQPLWVCQEPKCIIDAIWRGQKADFVFAISNGGEGDLQIKIKSG